MNSSPSRNSAQALSDWLTDFLKREPTLIDVRDMTLPKLQALVGYATAYDTPSRDQLEDRWQRHLQPKKSALSEKAANDVPLCGGCAQAWFTERNLLPGDQRCVVCAFLGNPDCDARPEVTSG